MGDFAYLVFLVVATVAATLMALFAAGLGAVLLYAPGGEAQSAPKASVPQANDPHLHSQAA